MRGMGISFGGRDEVGSLTGTSPTEFFRMSSARHLVNVYVLGWRLVRAGHAAAVVSTSIMLSRPRICSGSCLGASSSSGMSGR